MKRSITVVCAGAVLAANAAQGELWESKLTIHSASHGRMEMPAQQQCQKIVRSEAISPSDYLPSESKQCSKVKTKQSAGTFTWEMNCPEGKSTGSLRFVGRDALEGTMLSKTKDGDFRMEFKGRRIGRTCELDPDH